jgi:ribonucleoside-diphosphate reductase alpha chain
MRRLALDYLSFDDRLELGLASLEDIPETQTTLLTDDRSVEGKIVETSEQSVPEDAERSAVAAPTAVERNEQRKEVVVDNTAPLCYNCGNRTQRSGTCYVCTSCGSTTGCS